MVSVPVVTSTIGLDPVWPVFLMTNEGFVVENVAEEKPAL